MSVVMLNLLQSHCSTASFQYDTFCSLWSAVRSALASACDIRFDRIFI